jgi:hypothetical protein
MYTVKGGAKASGLNRRSRTLGNPHKFRGYPSSKKRKNTKVAGTFGLEDPKPGWSEPAATNAPIEDEAIEAVLGMNQKHILPRLEFLVFHPLLCHKKFPSYLPPPSYLPHLILHSLHCQSSGVVGVGATVMRDPGKSLK